MTFDELRQDDEVIMSGESSSPQGRQWDRASGMVATVSKEDRYVKIWIGDDKVWFQADKLTQIELVSR